MDQDRRSGEAPARAADLSRIYRLLLAVAVTAAAGVTVWLFGDVLTVVFAATLLAVILHGIGRVLARLSGLPYGATLTATVLGAIAMATVLCWQAGPSLADQLGQLKGVLSQQAGVLREYLSQREWGRVLLNQVPEKFGGNQQGGTTGIPFSLAGPVAGYLSSALGLLGTTGVVAITALYFAYSPAVYVNGALRIVPPAHRASARDYLSASGDALWSWSIGQAIDMAAVTLLSWLGLWLLGVPLAFVLALIAGLFNFVPYIGAIVGAVPAVIIAFAQGVAPGVETIALFVAVQTLEGNVLAPVIQRRTVDLPPGVTILAQTVASAVLGVPGLIFATPLTAVAMTVIQHATPPLDDKERVAGP